MSELENNFVEEGLPILIKAAGPIVIGGKCVITKADGTVDIKEKASLCGCGASANKPYCDGSHKQLAANSSSNVA